MVVARILLRRREPVKELPEESRQLLRDARRNFPSYYAAATPEEAELMNKLVLGYAAYDATVNFKREGRPEKLLRHVAKLSFEVEQLFAHFREAVRKSAVYRTSGEQEKIWAMLFAE